MMYGHKLAAAIRVSGKVLREDHDKVYLPFGSEYSLYLKNLSDVRALVTVAIDGRDISDGTRSFIIKPNDTLELERFLPNGNVDAGNRFRFIERTEGIEEHRGVGIDDGIVRIEYQFERQTYSTPKRYLSSIRAHDGVMSSRGINRRMQASNTLSGSQAWYGSSSNTLSGAQAYYQTDMSNINIHDMTETSAQAGITTEGSISEQKFNLSSGFPVEHTRHSLVLKLLGKTETKTVTKPYTVKMKSHCDNCGHSFRGFPKFCPDCGTGMQVVA